MSVIWKRTEGCEVIMQFTPEDTSPQEHCDACSINEVKPINRNAKQIGFMLEK